MARPQDAAACTVLRGQTRENAISAPELAALGITPASWAAATERGELDGWVCRDAGQLVGYCFGSPLTGEVMVLALLPAYENHGIGRELLRRVVAGLFNRGHTRLFLASSPEASVRSFGFYRHLGWSSTGTFDAHGDEILELVRTAGHFSEP